MPDAVDWSKDLATLAALAPRPDATTDVLERALDSLGALVPYDLAAIFRLDGERLRLIAAAGPLADAKVRRHELPLARFPTLRRALELRRPAALTEHHHQGEEGDPYDGVLDLPHGHSCMVVPLFAGERSLGLITLDRAQCGAYPEPAVSLAGVYGQIVSFALLFAEQASLLDRYRHQLKEQNRLLEAEVGGAETACHRLEAARDPAMRELVRLAKQVARADLPVLVLGETGTGKEVLAQAIHTWSPRVDGPFVKLNCSAIPESLVESELFGHVRGAFSGADRDRRGRFATANGGTLLLDEIGDMPLSAQAKLLRVLQEGTFEPVGSDRTVKVDVRVVAATHVDLQAAVRERRFREDLWFRLAVLPLRIPPLRERPADLLPIVEDALARARRRDRGPWTLSPAARAALLAHPWPGNVRELVNAVERATLLQPAGVIDVAHLGLGPPPAARSPAPSPPTTWEENERAYLAALLEHTGGRVYGPDGAAALADLPPTTLQSKLRRFGLR